MADRNVNTNLNVTGTLNATTVQEGGVPVVVSSDIDTVVEITQEAYDALGPGRPAGTLYVITGVAGGSPFVVDGGNASTVF